MTKFAFECCNSKVDRKTANEMSRLKVEASNENEALTSAAKEIWQECGWDSEKRCAAHIYENFCAIED